MHSRQTRGVLRLVFFYRLGLACLLNFFFFTNTGPAILGQAFPTLFAPVSVLYLVTVIASGIFLTSRSTLPAQQAHVIVFSDIVLITLLMHASGGVNSGLGMLIAVSIAAGSLLMEGRNAVLLAALAALAILTEQLYADLNDVFPKTGYIQSGLLGAAFFAMALLAHVLSQRIQESEQLATQRGLDLANLAQLNAYIIQHLQTGILVVDSDQKIRFLNDAAWYQLGMPDARVGSFLVAASPELARLLVRRRQHTRQDADTFRATPGGNELRPIFNPLGNDESAGTLIFLEDSSFVTQQAQQMKLASLGRLTASIAHEIRNPLGAISHAGQLLAESPELARGDRRLTEIIRTNSERMNEIIENVLQLSRRDRYRPESISLHQWLNDFVEEFARTQNLPPTTLSAQVDPADTRVEADPGQLRQIVSNLCENALTHAKQDDQPLKIRIFGGITRESRGPFIDITDNGPGIAPEVAKQIFEPFFTTHHTGTGLGLYIAKELSEANRVLLEYIPLPTGGSCFRIRFAGAPLQDARA